MKLELKPGEAVEVTLEGTDGIITVMFAAGGSLVRVHADLPDSQGRVGVIYEEDGDKPKRAPCSSTCMCNYPNPCPT